MDTMKSQLPLLALLALSAHASVISGNTTSSCAGGTFGHITLSNCSTNVSYSYEEGQGSAFAMSFTVDPFQPFPGTHNVSLALNGGIALNTSAASEFIFSTIDVDYTIDPNWHVQRMLWIFPHTDGGTAISASATITGTVGHLSILERLTTSPVCGICGGHSTGDVGGGYLLLLQSDLGPPVVSNPEPGTQITILVALCILFRWLRVRVNRESKCLNARPATSRALRQ